MATVIFTLSAADLTRMVNALGARFGYQATIDGAPNPQTKGEFVRLRIAQWVKAETAAHERATLQAAVVVPSDLDIT